MRFRRETAAAAVTLRKSELDGNKKNKKTESETMQCGWQLYIFFLRLSAWARVQCKKKVNEKNSEPILAYSFVSHLLFSASLFSHIYFFRVSVMSSNMNKLEVFLFIHILFGSARFSTHRNRYRIGKIYFSFFSRFLVGRCSLLAELVLSMCAPSRRE